LSSADYWDISSSITRLLTDAENEVAPTSVALQLLATRLAWDVAVFWIVNEIRMVLECSDF